MNFKRQRRSARQASVVELTPLIDVVFLLLIFFMVSTTFAHGEIKIALPAAAATPVSADGQAVEVRVSAAGDVAVDGRVLPDESFEMLRDALARQADSHTALVVYADANATHQSVTRVLDAAGRVGLRDIRLATQPTATETAQQRASGGEEPSAGEREGDTPRKKEPSAGEREGDTPRKKEPSAGEREGDTPRKKEPSAGEREGDTPRKKEPSAGEREGGTPRKKEPPRAEKPTRAP